MIQNKYYSKHWKTAIWGLLIASLLICWTCQKTELRLVPLGDERAVGIIDQGEITWNADENPNGKYIIVTKALIYKFAQTLAKNIRLEKELEIERAKEKRQ